MHEFKKRAKEMIDINLKKYDSKRAFKIFIDTTIVSFLDILIMSAVK